MVSRNGDRAITVASSSISTLTHPDPSGCNPPHISNRSENRTSTPTADQDSDHKDVCKQGDQTMDASKYLGRSPRPGLSVWSQLPQFAAVRRRSTSERHGRPESSRINADAPSQTWKACSCDSNCDSNDRAGPGHPGPIRKESRERRTATDQTVTRSVLRAPRRAPELHGPALSWATCTRSHAEPTLSGTRARPSQRECHGHWPMSGGGITGGGPGCHSMRVDAMSCIATNRDIGVSTSSGNGSLANGLSYLAISGS
jgi:hypothetical protein